MPSAAYEVTTETVMPHLEENLRYATTRRLRCLSRQELLAAFPLLGHEALAGCRLEEQGRDAESVSYRLICAGAGGTRSETTGAARWHLGVDRLQGTLDVKLGGKNMTFQQRVTARPVGACGAQTK